MKVEGTWISIPSLISSKLFALTMDDYTGGRYLILSSKQVGSMRHTGDACEPLLYSFRSGHGGEGKKWNDAGEGLLSFVENTPCQDH